VQRESWVPDLPSRLGDGIGCPLPKGRSECFEIGLQEPDIAAHHPKVRNLFAFDPLVNGLNADTQVLCSVPDCERKFVCREPRSGRANSRRAVLGEVFWTHAYL
jgi:hypothetical protein